MMNTICRIIATGMLALTMLFAAPVAITNAADNPFSGACKGGGSGSAFCADIKTGNDDPLTGKNGVIIKIVNIVAIVAGAAAIIVIVLAGLRLITSGGSSENVAGARNTIIYAAIGLVVLVLARTIVAFVLGKV